MVNRINQVVEALNEAGIRAKRGYPQVKYFRPNSPVATVYLDSVRGDVVTVAAQIFAVRASDCENQAEVALTALVWLLGECSVESCHFDQQMGLFSIRILICWDPTLLEVPGPDPDLAGQLPYSVQLNGDTLPYVTECSVFFLGELFKGASGDGTDEIGYNVNAWSVTIKEQIPLTQTLQESVKEPFTLTVVHQNGSETFKLCRWDSIYRKETAEGVQQVRVAKTWEAREVQ